MNRLLLYSVMVSSMLALFACGTAAKEIQAGPQSEQTEVFTEAENGGAIPNGYAGLTIKANIKTHSEGYYILESKESRHGKEKYPFLIHIDGQTVEWEVDGVKDSKPAYDLDGKSSRDPEAREGIRYALEKKVLVAAGAHHVFFGLPAEQYAAELKIFLKEGGTNVLEFKPVYRTKRLPSRIPTFLKGMYRYDVFLNGEMLPQECPGNAGSASVIVNQGKR